MKINNVEFNAELEEILKELQRELHINQIPLLNKMKGTTSDIMVTCPYHSLGQEKRPSAGIRRDDGMFHCFACGEVHSLPEIISHCFGKDDNGLFGWKWLLNKFGTVGVEERKDVVLDFNRYMGNTDISCIRNKEFGEYITEEELDSYRYIHPYMYERGLTDEIIEIFDIGYDVSTQSITFPVKDVHGNCLFIARRSVKNKWFNYPKGVEKPLYGLYELYSLYIDGFFVNQIPNDEVIVCESMLDALSFWTVGKCAVALNGLGNELQFKQLKELPCRKIILATDMDERGLSARKRIRFKLQNKKIVTEYYFPNGKKDANECTAEELKNLQEWL